MKKIAAFLLLYIPLLVAKPVISTVLHSDTSKEIILSFALPAGDWIYFDTIQVGVDHPAIALKQWHCSNDSHTVFDPVFKDQKKVVTGNFRITALVEMVAEFHDEAFLFVTYYQKNKKRMNQILVPVHFHELSPPIESTQEDDSPQIYQSDRTLRAKQKPLPLAHEHGIIILVTIGFFALLSACINLVRSQNRAVWLRDIKQYLLLSLAGVGIYLIGLWHQMPTILPLFLCASGLYLLRTDQRTNSTATLVKKIVAVGTLTAAWVLTTTMACLWYLH